MPPRPCCGNTAGARQRARIREERQRRLLVGGDGGGRDYARITDSFKVVTLGESSVGKTSLVMRLVRDEFSERSDSTIGAAFFSHTVCLSGLLTNSTQMKTECGSEFKFDLWDTAGQERFRTLAPMYYRGCAAAIVVFDLTSGESFVRAKAWVSEVTRQVKGAVIALVGNKCDLPERDVKPAEVMAYAKDNDFVFMETSAKTGKNVRELFLEVGNRMVKYRAEHRPDGLSPDEDDIPLL